MLPFEGDMNKLKRIESRKSYYILEGSTHFLCRACCEKLPLEKMSKDARYCGFCQGFIEDEYRVRAEGRDISLESLYKPLERLSTVKEGGTNLLCGENVPSMKLSHQKGPYQKQELPEKLILDMSHQGRGSRVIAAYLGLQGIYISYRTVQRVIRGERKQFGG